GRNCGDVDNGCGQTMNCGTCSEPLSCSAAPGRPNLCGCTPNAFLCVGDELRQCTADGSKTFLVAQCPAGACNATIGQCTSCTPGSQYCSGKQLYVCNAFGDGWTPKGSPCNANQFCDPKGLGQCDICVEGGFFCLGANLRKCNAEGQGTSLVESCENEKLCARGVFLGKCPKPVCQPGERRCSGNKAQLCNAEQDGWDTVDTCASAALCGKSTKGICDPPVCDPGDTSCQGNIQKVCNADRTGFDLIPCKLPTPVCENGVCSARGPTMVIAKSSQGVPFYIDSTEVTAAQYQQFLESNQPPQSVTGSPSVCTWNTSYWDDLQPPTANGFDLPVVRVDWCDAFAYCQWAGKRLCGKVGGGPLVAAEINDRAKSMWYAACRGPDDTTYPYGNVYSGSLCNGNDYGVKGLIPVGSATNCVGGFDGIFDMSGNVQEWEDSCTGNDGASDACRVRGGFFSSTQATALSCSASNTIVRNVKSSSGIGFRCCGDF
ncbi:MAG: SUMF1/EgtB/PvdO family nonheme iron enzyme, partial [Myxococcales bacterium]|nr:formylglycine-generating enzyme family protein [Polyangiaceae bacterium]MDW8247699.1 SUMF1/EgtB/PvdO family nonheme iron enzyme [Myxococcales bacterium]